MHPALRVQQVERLQQAVRLQRAYVVHHAAWVQEAQGMLHAREVQPVLIAHRLQRG